MCACCFYCGQQASFTPWIGSAIRVMANRCPIRRNMARPLVHLRESRACFTLKPAGLNEVGGSILAFPFVRRLSYPEHQRERLSRLLRIQALTMLGG